jgi:histone deacetylase 1/2
LIVNGYGKLKGKQTVPLIVTKAGWLQKDISKGMGLTMKTSKADTSLFFYMKGSNIIYLLVYVDDIIVVSSSSRAVEALLADLKRDFALKDLGELSYFLGIEILPWN